jgi:ubiquinol-cytochrome c reductase iron-sulfur subunit
MANEGVDPRRRRVLTAAATVVGGAGVVATLWPFLASMKPSARAQAAGAPVEVDVSRLEVGQRTIHEWRGKPVWVIRRSEQMVGALSSMTPKLRDPESKQEQQPEYAQNAHRSIKPDYLVLVGICTHLGCSPLFRPEVAPADLGPEWKGGFYCPCHGSRFDLAGRVYKNVPAPTNLVVPPYRFESDTQLVIGEDAKEGGVA